MSVTREMVFTTCDELVRSNQPVSFRKLYATVGGNRENVRQWWHQWCREAGQEEALLPEAFTTAMQRFLQTDEWEARYQALTQELLPAAEERLARLDAQGHEAEERLQTVRAQMKAAVEELQVLRAERLANRHALLAYVSGADDGTTP